jgi:hypothetical protein
MEIDAAIARDSPRQFQDAGRSLRDLPCPVVRSAEALERWCAGLQ